MLITSQQFARDILVALPEPERGLRLRELESIVNRELQSCATLPDFQQQLYGIIEELSALGHVLGPWEYDCEVEIWGGASYMDQSIEDELLLRSEFPHGIRLAWKDYDALHG